MKFLFWKRYWSSVKSNTCSSNSKQWYSIL